MIPIITQILPHTTCSGRGEVMLRCEKASLTLNLQIQIESAFSTLSKNTDTHIVFDTHKDPIADWIYIYAQAKQLDALLKSILEPSILLMRSEKCEILSRQLGSFLKTVLRAICSLLKKSKS